MSGSAYSIEGDSARTNQSSGLPEVTLLVLLASYDTKAENRPESVVTHFRHEAQNSIPMTVSSIRRRHEKIMLVIKTEAMREILPYMPQPVDVIIRNSDKVLFVMSSHFYLLS